MDVNAQIIYYAFMGIIQIIRLRSIWKSRLPKIGYKFYARFMKEYKDNVVSWSFECGLVKASNPS